MSHPDPRQAPNLFVDALRHFSNLMQKELHLAKAELSQNISRAGMGLAFFAVAGLLALTALNVLAGALVAYIAAAGLGAGTAALIVGAVLLIGAAVLVFAGKARLSAEALKPTHTMHNIQRDAATLKGAGHV